MEIINNEQWLIQDIQTKGVVDQGIVATERGVMRDVVASPHSGKVMPTHKICFHFFTCK